MDRTDAGGVVIVATSAGAVRVVLDRRPAEVRVGVEVSDPLTLARALRAVHPELLLGFEVREDEVERFRRAFTDSPVLGGPVHLLLPGGAEGPAIGAGGGAASVVWEGIEAAPDGALLVDGDGVILALSARGAAMLGGVERELLGTPVAAWFEAEARARVGAHLRDGGSALFGRAGGALVTLVSWRCPGADPTLRLVLLRGPAPAELHLRTEQQFLDAIVENLPTMVFVKEAKDLRFVRFNRAGEELLGYPRAEMLGRNDYDFFPKAEADFFTQKDREVLAGGAAVEIPAEPIHTRAGLRWLHTRKVPVVDGAGKPHLLGISEDITAAQRTEEERARLVAELERSNGELQLFATIASHDLQEPLRKVQQFGARLRADLGDGLPPQAGESLARMDAAVGRMRELIEGLLAYSRVTYRGAPLLAVALDPVLADVLADLDVAVTQSGARVRVGPLPMVQGDRSQLRQLFQNLVGNALKFTPPGVAPVVEVTGAVRVDTPGAEPIAEIRVRDEGIGFSMADAATAFQPFQRLAARQGYQGTGIGLAICARIVERHRGAISVETAPGRGATFIVRLPVARAG